MNDANAFKSWLLKNYDYSENTLQSYLFTFKDFFKKNNEINSENARRYIQLLEKENNLLTKVNKNFVLRSFFKLFVKK